MTNGATLTMIGGSINTNTISPLGAPDETNAGGAMGGGVYIITGATMTMSDGTINNNIVSATSSTAGLAEGGGLYIYTSGNFTMTGGAISGNSTFASAGISAGGGIFSYGNMTLDGGSITTNRCEGVLTVIKMGGGISIPNPHRKLDIYKIKIKN